MLTTDGGRWNLQLIRATKRYARALRDVLGDDEAVRREVLEKTRGLYADSDPDELTLILDLAMGATMDVLAGPAPEWTVARWLAGVEARQLAEMCTSVIVAQAGA